MFDTTATYVMWIGVIVAYLILSFLSWNWRTLLKSVTEDNKSMSEMLQSLMSNFTQSQIDVVNGLMDKIQSEPVAVDFKDTTTVDDIEGHKIVEVTDGTTIIYIITIRITPHQIYLNDLVVAVFGVVDPDDLNIRICDSHEMLSVYFEGIDEHISQPVYKWLVMYPDEAVLMVIDL